MRNFVMISIWLCVASMMVAAQEPIKIPAEVTPFVEKGTTAIALEKGDLNGDGREDFILLALTKRNERIVMCSQCGGIFGDPFEGVVAGRNTFSVEHYGGSGVRWKYSYKFNYSRIDQTWQLVRVEELSYQTSNPNKGKTQIYTAPKDFGKIDIADFDPENYLNTAAKRRAGK